jgi:hypothetical protein
MPVSVVANVVAAAAALFLLDAVADVVSQARRPWRDRLRGCTQ